MVVLHMGVHYIYYSRHSACQGHALEHNNEINKALGKIWKRATEEEKRVYEERATADKLRYLQVPASVVQSMQSVQYYVLSVSQCSVCLQRGTCLFRFH